MAVFFLALIGAGAWLVFRRIAPEIPFGPTPHPPTIKAPRGPLPQGRAGLEEWAQYRGAQYRRVGSGFLFALETGETIAATTAHSLQFGGEQARLESVAFTPPGLEDFLFETARLHGDPGLPRVFGLDLTIDYVLLQVPEGIPAELILTPDPRGKPQAGERVQLHSGVIVETGQSVLRGAVLSAEERGAWVVMEEIFQPGLMSGSPFLSEHTGQVVGMAIAAGFREGYVVIGMHPIRSLVNKAESAQHDRLIAEYER